MPPIPYTEDTLVQQTTAEYLEREPGWESMYAYNKEDFGPDGLLGRASDREVALTRILRAKIEELNPGLPATAYDDAVRQTRRCHPAARPQGLRAVLRTDRFLFVLIVYGIFHLFLGVPFPESIF